MAVPQWQKGTVKRIVQETWNTRRYFIQVKDTEEFHFKAGQFVTLDLPIGERPVQRWRSYSIASYPDGSNIIELLIVFLEGGAGTTYIFNEIGVGSELLLRGPQGLFTIPDTIETDLFFICTGTGIAPFRSILYDIFCRKKACKSIYLLYGCRTRNDLLYFKELSALQEKMPSFHFIPTLSRESWEGKTGYVHQLYEHICLSNSQGHPEIADNYPAIFYLCGWKFMIEDAQKKLSQMGYDKKSIRFELYG